MSEAAAKADELSDWLTTAQAAALMKKSQRRVQQLVQGGELEYREITPRLFLISRQSVETYIRQHG